MYAVAELTMAGCVALSTTCTNGCTRQHRELAGSGKVMSSGKGKSGSSKVVTDRSRGVPSPRSGKNGELGDSGKGKGGNSDGNGDGDDGDGDDSGGGGDGGGGGGGGGGGSTSDRKDFLSNSLF